MRFNQFGKVTVSYPQALKELQTIRFLAGVELNKITPNALWLHFLAQASPLAHSQSAKKARLNSLLANEYQTVLEYTTTNTVNAESFYAVALQLLGFEVDEDFDLADVFAALKRLNLAYHPTINSKEDLLLAWYDLLETVGKNGRTLLDNLASAGYFTPFYELAATQKPLFFNGKSLPIFDTSKLISEVVYVESDLDSDHDGRADLLKVEIIRPLDTNNGLKVPALYTASPYNQGTNDQLGKKLTHKVDVKLATKPVTNTSYEEIAYHAPKVGPIEKRPVAGHAQFAEESLERELSYTFNDYMLARGFAAVYAAGIGTKDSDGLRTCGSPAETASTVAVIEWLAGSRKAFTNKTDNIEIKAWWCNGAVAMTGKSYLGTLATAAATSGTPGLKTIISEAAISNWYDYYRDGGLVVAPGGFPGEDADVLIAECFSRKKEAADYLQIKDKFEADLKQVTVDQDRTSGNYNRFWDARNYLKDLHNIKCDIVMVHGLNDWNVKLRNVFNLYKQTENLKLKRKLILHQGQHIYINNFQSLDFSDMMNLWLSHKLYGLDNQAPEILPDVLVQDNTLEGTWHQFADWDGAETELHSLHFDQHQLVAKPNPAAGPASFTDHLLAEAFKRYSQNYHQWQADLLARKAPLTTSSLLFESQPLTTALYLQGTPRLKLRVAASQDHGLLSFMLVDYGQAKRLGKTPDLLLSKGLNAGYRFREDNLVEFKLKKASPYQLITKGHINLQNRTSLWQNDELKPDTFYDLNVVLQPMFYKLLAGHKLGLIVYSSDMEMTVHANEELNYSLDLAACRLDFDASKIDD